jgi:prepilin-type N-terminal cleavage/methylation domain-containing protein
VRRLNAVVKKTGSAGFTLIELLVVIIVLGILAAIVAFAVGGTRRDAVNSVCRSDVRSINLAAEWYFTHNGKFPADSSELVVPAQFGQLKAWPGGASASDANLVFTYAPNASHGYQLTVSGQTFNPAHVVFGDATDSDVNSACTPS